VVTGSAIVPAQEKCGGSVISPLLVAGVALLAIDALRNDVALVRETAPERGDRAFLDPAMAVQTR
jgi:hypothetical protein